MLSTKDRDMKERLKISKESFTTWRRRELMFSILLRHNIINGLASLSSLFQIWMQQALRLRLISKKSGSILTKCFKLERSRPIFCTRDNSFYKKIMKSQKSKSSPGNLKTKFKIVIKWLLTRISKLRRFKIR